MAIIDMNSIDTNFECIPGDSPGDDTRDDTLIINQTGNSFSITDSDGHTFNGTIDGATVYPRVVAEKALRHGAAALIAAHNHPSGVSEPSLADQAITRRLKEALALLDIRVLDHIIVGRGREDLSGVEQVLRIEGAADERHEGAACERDEGAADSGREAAAIGHEARARAACRGGGLAPA